jgi:hypothetical protein
MSEEITYGLRHPDGTFARVRHDYDGDPASEGGDFHFIVFGDPDLPVWRTPNFDDLLVLSRHEFSEWGSSSNRPSNRHELKTVQSCGLVRFVETKVWDERGGDPVATSVRAEPVTMRVLDASFVGRGGGTSAWKAERALFESAGDEQPWYERMEVLANETPSGGMYAADDAGNLFQIVDFKKEEAVGSRTRYRLLVETNPARFRPTP